MASGRAEGQSAPSGTQLQANQATVKLQGEEIRGLSAKLEETTRDNKAIYNELLEVTLQLRQLQQIETVEQVGKGLKAKNI